MYLTNEKRKYNVDLELFYEKENLHNIKKYITSFSNKDDQEKFFKMLYEEDPKKLFEDCMTYINFQVNIKTIKVNDDIFIPIGDDEKFFSKLDADGRIISVYRFSIAKNKIKRVIKFKIDYSEQDSIYVERTSTYSKNKIGKRYMYKDGELRMIITSANDEITEILSREEVDNKCKKEIESYIIDGELVKSRELVINYNEDESTNSSEYAYVENKAQLIATSFNKKIDSRREIIVTKS